MSFPHEQTVPINECGHEVHRFDGASEVIKVVSPDGRPVSGPRNPTSRSVLFRHTLEVMLSFATGFLTATAVVLWI